MCAAEEGGREGERREGREALKRSNCRDVMMMVVDVVTQLDRPEVTRLVFFVLGSVHFL